MPFARACCEVGIISFKLWLSVMIAYLIDYLLSTVMIASKTHQNWELIDEIDKTS